MKGMEKHFLSLQLFKRAVWSKQSRHFVAYCLSLLVCASILGCQPSVTTPVPSETTNSQSAQQVSPVNTKTAQSQAEPGLKTENEKKGVVITLKPGEPIPFIKPGNTVIVHEGQIEPPNPFIIKDYPLTRGILKWPKMTVKQEIPLYQDKNEKSPVVAKLVPGDIVQGMESEFYAYPAKITVTKDYTSFQGQKFTKGEVLYALNRYEEGTYFIWQKGKAFYLELYEIKGAKGYEQGSADAAWGELENEPEGNLWIKFTAKSGQSGWCNFNRDNFEPPQRLPAHIAEKKDIIGIWKYIAYPEDIRKLINKDEPWPLPYQWFGIYEDGQFYSIMSEQDREFSAKQLDEMFKSISQKATYQFDNGILTIDYANGHKELWVVGVFEKDFEHLGVKHQQGDIVMDLHDGTDTPRYHRHLMKIY